MAGWEFKSHTIVCFALALADVFALIWFAWFALAVADVKIFSGGNQVDYKVHWYKTQVSFIRPETTGIRKFLDFTTNAKLLLFYAQSDFMRSLTLCAVEFYA